MQVNPDDLEIIGSPDEEIETNLGRVARVVFGSLVKLHGSDGHDDMEKMLLRKAEVYADRQSSKGVLIYLQRTRFCFVRIL